MPGFSWNVLVFKSHLINPVMRQPHNVLSPASLNRGGVVELRQGWARAYPQRQSGLAGVWQLTRLIIQLPIFISIYFVVAVGVCRRSGASMRTFALRRETLWR
jgi:hypothetical protein